MLTNHVMGNSWGPIEYRETGLYNFDQKLPSRDVVKSMSCFSDFNHILPNWQRSPKILLVKRKNSS